MKRDRESADQEIINLVIVEQSQELFEVLRKLDRFHS